MKVKHILSVVLAVFLILSVTSPVLGASINADASVAVVAGIEEEKMFCTATVEDDFEDDKVIVVLNNIASLEKIRFWKQSKLWR